jgi:quinol---cytochrome c reductase cytochrome c subunit, bacillus type
MNEQEKRDYDRTYKAAKRQGEPFYPNAIIKDALVALFIFLILVALSAFFRAELQAPADPSDSSYIPHPEWYFLFLYEMLKFFPGDLVIFGVIVLPGVVFLILFLLPWLDRHAERHPRKRPAIMAVLMFAWTIIVGFTFLAFISAPRQAETAPAVVGLNRQQADIGQAAFVETCSGCHGEYGEGGPNPSKPGSIIPPISSKAFLAAFTDDTLFNIVSNGLSERGMAAFSARNGGPLDDSKIELIVSYLRHWETNPPVVAEYVPPTPSTPNGEALFTTVCAPCHGLHGEGGIGPTLATLDFSKRFPIDSLHRPTSQTSDSVSQHVLERMRALTGAQLEAVMNYTYSLSPSGGPVVEAPSADRGDPANGAALFHSWCTNCHGSDGTNPVGPDHIITVDPAFQASMTDAQLIDAISQGFPKPDEMPAFREILSSQEMSDVLAWLRTFRAK